ncbi:MAG: L-2-hydroxyglutarate oxidase [Solirubrobacterales bacterium]
MTSDRRLSKRVDALVVGGGIVGLATARQMLIARPGTELVLLEREAEVARQQTGHNSGVVHAGLYYRPGSLKASLCRRGMGLLSEFCASEGIEYDRCGKLVVATDLPARRRLEALAERAAENEIDGLAWLEEGEMQRVEPHVRGIAALHSPSTAIVDFGAVSQALARSIELVGGSIRTGTGVRRIRETAGSAIVELDSSEEIKADRVVVCAGLESDRLARASGQGEDPRIIPFRGEYWKLRAERTGLVRGLIYPVPDPSLPFLGVHITRKVGGEVWLGPNAVLATALDGYRWRDIRRADLAHIFGWPGTWRMMRAHWRVGLHELLVSRRKASFVREAARFLPELRVDDVVRAGAGVRAQAVDRAGGFVDDFRIGTGRRVVWVRNAPSPAATSALAIAEELVEG